MAGGFGGSGEIGLGELVEALVRLRPEAAVAEGIASALGMEWRGTPGGEAGGPSAALAPGGATVPEAPLPQPGTVQPAPLELPPVRTATATLNLARSDPQKAASGMLASSDLRTQTEKAPYRPLFRDVWWRALARTMLATPAATSTIDLRVVSKHLRSGRPIERLPWLLKATLRRGVVLILDRSESMQPFWRDESELVERCNRVVGGPGVRAYWVETDPWSDAEVKLRWLRDEPEGFTAQTPVVIVSDFELGREMTPRWPVLTPWLPLLEKARSAGATVLALVPLGRALWPAALTKAIPNAIPWDDDTTPGAVRRSIF